MSNLSDLFSSSVFLPHGQCLLWQSGLLWLHAVSDTLITMAYYSIPITLGYFLKKRRDLAFPWMFLLFGIFIFLCGTTHLIGVWTLWKPVYWLDGIIKLMTAGVSVATAILLVPLVPRAIALPSPAQLETVNAELRREIAERKRAEEEMRKLNAQLEAANKELEAFSYSVSHDLRAPLRHIHGFVEMLRAHIGASLDAKGQHYMNTIIDSAGRMGGLIDDLLVFSRMGKSEMCIGKVNLDHLVREVLDDLRPEIQGREIVWKIDRLPKVYGDAAMLKQVWVNLIGNAVKYTRTRARAEIEIGSRPEEEEYVFMVRDNGVGFDPRYSDKLFGVFQRLHGSDEFEGTGIGLANVRRIVHRHGGRTWAKGGIDGGAVFYFSLPIREGTPG